MRGKTFALAILFVCTVPPLLSATTQFVVQETYRGLSLGAIGLRPDVKLDIAPLEARKAMARLKEAIDILHRKSPFSIRAIETLQSAGNVVIVYDPHFPKSRFSGLTIAAYFPEYYQASGPSKQFVTVVGRYGAKWPAAELAAVLVHELVGHGMQRYRGRLEHVRTIDLECEAYLYEERAYQDIGIDKRSTKMIKFRRALEDNWCKTFRMQTRRSHPSSVALWERLDPDVPGILKVYLDYIEVLRKNGAARKAIDIERRDGLRR